MSLRVFRDNQICLLPGTREQPAFPLRGHAAASTGKVGAFRNASRVATAKVNRGLFIREFDKDEYFLPGNAKNIRNKFKELVNTAPLIQQT